MATTEELAEYYAGLLILQYAQKPKAAATIQATVTPVIMDQLPQAINDAFNIETAVGVQLDTIGKYIGANRNGYGTEGQPITLIDSDFRQLVKLILIKNNAGSSLAIIQSLLSANFPGQIFVSDNTSMALNYVLIETLGTSDLLEVIVTGGYLPRPMGVAISTSIVPSHPNPFFGFRTAEAPDPTVAPFNTAEFVILTYPWLDANEVH